jgi:hypothetical protein
MSIGAPTDGIKPLAIYPYFDVVTVWFKRPLSRKNRDLLRRHCGPGTRPMRPSPWLNFREGWRLHQPSDKALAMLARRSGVHINYAEFALDWIFETEDEREHAFGFVDLTHVKKHHHQQELRYCRGTRYTASRHAAINFVAYDDKPCRVTGEVCCLHLEWRVRRPRTLRRLGMHCIADLLEFDHRQFWEERLLLYEVDVAKLGRRHRNHCRSSRGQAPCTDPCDPSMGRTLLRSIARHDGATRIQDVVDWFRHLGVRRCLIPVDVRHLLPRPLFADTLYNDVCGPTATTQPNTLIPREITSPEQTFSDVFPSPSTVPSQEPTIGTTISHRMGCSPVWRTQHRPRLHTVSRPRDA